MISLLFLELCGFRVLCVVVSLVFNFCVFVFFMVFVIVCDVVVVIVLLMF